MLSEPLADLRGRAGESLRSTVAPGVLPASLGLAAVAVGALSTTRPTLAIAVVIAAGTVLLIAARIEALPPILVLTMYAEGVSLGGAHVGRLMGLFALAAMAYYLLVRGRAELETNVLLAVASAYGFWILMSYYWALSHHYVFITFLKWALSFAFMLAFALLIRSEADLRAVLQAFVFAAVVFGLASLAAYSNTSGGLRGAGLQGDPNIFAAYQTLAVAMALALAGLDHRPYVRLGYYVSVAFIIVSIGASFSRGGLISLGVVVACALLLPWRLFFRRPGQKVAFTLSLALGGWFVALLGSTAYLTRIQSTFHGHDRGSGRLDLWSAALNGYSHHPWLGLGAGGFQSHSLDFLHNTPGVARGSLNEPSGRPVHNSYLEALTDLGPVGLTIHLLLISLTAWFLLSAARRYRRAGNGAMERLTVSLIVSFVSILVASFFLSIGLGKPIWVFVGLALALRRIAPGPPADPRPKAVRRPAFSSSLRSTVPGPTALTRRPQPRSSIER
jgi:O-antigen ligase